MSSPFHPGEQALQSQFAVRDRVERIARKTIRAHLPEQHRSFFARLPVIFMASLDAAGRPWASILEGPAGFVSSPDSRSISISAAPLTGDPLRKNLHVDAQAAVLGIDFENRRRNRLSGRVTRREEALVAIAVSQSFGNCPKFIQTRRLVQPALNSCAEEPQIRHMSSLDRRSQSLIGLSDTFFIATSYQGEAEALVSDAASDLSAREPRPEHGADISHRGGRPGFVRIIDDRHLIYPDFSGNSYFNTLGNLLLHPRAGLLFVDFAAGDLLMLTGSAELKAAGSEETSFAGAQQFVRITIDETVFVERGMRTRWAFASYSPQLAQTGRWRDTGSRDPDGLQSAFDT